MALPKLFQRIFWHNDTTPALNEDNLNAISKGLSDVDDRVIDLGSTIMETVPLIQEMLEETQELMDDTEQYAQASEENALDSEAWAVGKRNGVDVPSTDPTYHNNAKWYAKIVKPPTVLTSTLAANATSVTFTGLPTTGNNMIDFFISDGSNYSAINISTPGQVTLTYDADSSARTVYCRIEEA